MRLLSAALTALLLSAAPVSALTVEGQSFDPAVTMDGQSLKLVGAGLREKWFMNVYAMGAYSASGACDAGALVRAEEPKMLRIKMLRDVSGAKMAATIGEAFDEHMPKDASAALKASRAKFQGYFTDECTKGTTIEFFYEPGQGTSYRHNGKNMGAIPGADFARVLWDIYFGGNSCCGGLKAGILKCGK